MSPASPSATLPGMTDASLVYVTAGSGEEARRIAATLVGERLAACANVLPPIRSVYRWHGEVRDDEEVALLLKTRAALVPRVSARVRELHSYDCPCVVAWPIADGDPAFLQWIHDETEALP